MFKFIYFAVYNNLNNSLQPHMKQLAYRLPERIRTPLQNIRNTLRALPYHGKGRYCPVCDKSSSHFRPAGIVLRKEAQCAHCGALERHRLLWLFLQKKTDIFNGKPKRMLHIAPEPFFESKLKLILGDFYLSADLFNTYAMVKMDICDIQYTDQSFDVIFCSHVLEHVPDDKRALRELYRVLKNDGWAIILVPIVGEKTFENPIIVDPKERLKAFGQEDHVRSYGPYFVERLYNTGFKVKISKADDFLYVEETAKMGLMSATDEIYYCTK